MGVTNHIMCDMIINNGFNHNGNMIIMGIVFTITIGIVYVYTLIYTLKIIFQYHD